MISRRILIKPGVAALILCAFTALAQAPGDVRVALVIGNSAYARAPLVNPANDARAMSETLRGLGFRVIEVRDGSKAQMADAVDLVRDSLKGKQGIGMLYYAGHGLQVDARNYMVPVDAKMAATADVAGQAMDVSGVIAAFRAAGTRMNILVLDACRDNPFGGITTGKGLAPLDAPSGTFLAYATAPGNVAEDGDIKSGNGLYTQFLLAELKKPQSRIEDVFKRVRFAVRKASSGRQIPWESTSLEDDFQFNDGRIAPVTRPTAAQLQAEFAPEIVEWDRIKASRNVDDFYAFLQKFPNGTVTEAANARLNLLARPTLVVQGGSGEARDQPYARTLFRDGDTYETRSTASLQPGATLTEEKVGVTPGGDVSVQVTYTTPGQPPRQMTKLYDPEGGFVGMKDLFRNNPPPYLAPAGLLQVGSTWKQASQIEMLTANVPRLPPSTSISKILARESITIAAGTFNTFRIESETLYAPGGPVKRNVCTFWVANDLPFPVKSSCASEGLQAYTSETELVRYKRGS
ncbi:MAG: caspase family protein [Burkholderiales bacterium]|nr:MAG: caspase family protein [Burkholderiales bacterium]